MDRERAGEPRSTRPSRDYVGHARRLLGAQRCRNHTPYASVAVRLNCIFVFRFVLRVRRCVALAVHRKRSRARAYRRLSCVINYGRGMYAYALSNRYAYARECRKNHTVRSVYVSRFRLARNVRVPRPCSL